MTSSTPSSSTTIPSWAIPSPSSQLSTSPSTVKSSIFSSADSILSTSPVSPLPGTTFKRKYGREIHEAKHGPKRRKVMGRPKNNWTPSRLRKLVRLYLMTNLTVEQILKVLQTREFHPSLRHTQEQLAHLLQARPNTIRLGAHVTKARLRVLRDCRELRQIQRMARPREPTPLNEVQTENDCVQEDTPESLLASGDDGDDSLWLDLGPGARLENPDPRIDQIATQSITKSHENSLELLLEGAEFPNLFSEMDALSPFEDTQAFKSTNFQKFSFGSRKEQPVEFTRESLPLNTSSISRVQEHNTGAQPAEERPRNTIQPTAVIDEWILPDFGMQSMESSLSPFRQPTISLTAEFAPQRLKTPGFVVEDYDLNGSDMRSASSSTESNLALAGENALPQVRPGPDGRLPIGGRPSRDSITSLDNRLPECSQSCIEDIVSILERHTISGSSAAGSSARTSHISSKKSSRVFQKQSDIERSLCLMEEPPLLPVRVKPPNVLPGIFHVYCAAQITQNKLRHCRHDGLPCEHTSPDTCRFFTSHVTSKTVIYNRIRSQDINETDQYGNSILHVAASFCAPIPYLIKLIKQRANINAVNNAGETFLHLLYAPIEEDGVCSLLEILNIEHFNFGQQDQHGQTSLHLITRPWLPQQYLVTVFRKIQSLGFVLPTSRDNLGFTLLRQMKHLGTQALGFDPGKANAVRLSLGLNCETQGYIVRPYSPMTSAKSTINGNELLHRSEKQKLVHSLDDLRRYEHHADLLRTIVNAGDRPWYEDSKGRNGLHCLAEVAFDLPLPDKFPTGPQSPKDKSAENNKDLRETYLDGLLAAGVNPNNCDKNGDTPLMSFITNVRVGEDENTLSRIILKLLAAKADISRRNRRGETALHLAVRLGQLATTKLLLRKGANVHARNKKGEGVQKVGTEACKKATQDETLYAQIMLCMDSAMRAGAVASPTIVQEWTSERVSEPPRI